MLSSGTAPGDFEGTVVDDDDATLTGDWTVASATKPFVGAGYRHDGDSAKGSKSARFVAQLPHAGHYQVRLAYSANPNRATNVPVTIEHAAGSAQLSVNQRLSPTVSGVFTVLGDYDFGTSASVEVSTAGTDGYVIVDAVQWVAQ